MYFALCFCLWTFPESKTDGRTVVATEYRKVLGLYEIRFESLDMVFGEYKMDKFYYVYLQKENGYEKC